METLLENQYFKVVQDGRYFTIEQNEGRGGVAAILRHGANYIFVRNNRHTTKEIELELAMGCVDEGETSEEALVREIREETGFVICSDQVRFLGRILPDPGIIKMFADIYYCDVTDCDQKEIIDTDEIDGLVYLTPDELSDQVIAGQVRNGITLAALHLHHVNTH